MGLNLGTIQVCFLFSPANYLFGKVQNRPLLYQPRARSGTSQCQKLDWDSESLRPSSRVAAQDKLSRRFGFGVAEKGLQNTELVCEILVTKLSRKMDGAVERSSPP
jgi:hypothetical protein